MTAAGGVGRFHRERCPAAEAAEVRDLRRRDDRSAAAANAVKSATADLAPPTTGGVRSRHRRHRPRRRLRSSIRRALRTDDQVPSPITDLQAAVDDAIAALDRLERAVKVRPGDDPRLIGLVRGAKDAVRAVRDRTIP